MGRGVRLDEPFLVANDAAKHANATLDDADPAHARPPPAWWPLSRLSPSTYGELRVWWALSWPAGASIMFRNAIPMIDVAFLGHLGTEYLAAAAIAQVWIVVTSAFIWQGCGQAVNTLGAQAHGAGNLPLVGRWAQISLLVTAALCVPVTVAWLFTSPALASLGFPQSQCDDAQTFATWYILYLWPAYLFVMLTNYLQAIGSVMPALWVNFAMAGANAGLNRLLIFGAGGWPGLGFKGSPIASACTAGLSLLALLAYMRWSRVHDGTWPAWSLEVLAPARVKTFMLQAAPNMLGAELEDLQLQVMSYLAASLGAADIATHNAFLQLFFVLTCAL
jgi:MATE family multidrug resistance protein